MSATGDSDRDVPVQRLQRESLDGSGNAQRLLFASAKALSFSLVHRIAEAVRGAIAARTPAFVFTEVTHVVRELPAPASGMRILQFSDLHLESTRYLSTLEVTACRTPFDVVVVTGDIASGPDAACHAHYFFRSLLERIDCPCFAVLGNHDRSTLIEPLRDCGVEVLLNESLCVSVGAARVWIAGVDDEYGFKSSDVKRAVRGIPHGEFFMLLAHSPDVASEAAAHGCRLFLCGHTHGGQVALPVIGPVGYWRRYPRQWIAGSWRHDGMVGYTNRGVGSHMGLPRIGCKPEVTVHTLRAT